MQSDLRLIKSPSPPPINFSKFDCSMSSYFLLTFLFLKLNNVTESGLNSGAGYVGFVVITVVLGQVHLPVLPFSPVCNDINAPYIYFIHMPPWLCNIKIDSVFK